MFIFRISKLEWVNKFAFQCTVLLYSILHCIQHYSKYKYISTAIVGSREGSHVPWLLVCWRKNIPTSTESHRGSAFLCRGNMLEMLKRGPRFTNSFSIAIQIIWKFHFHSHLDSNTVITAKFCTWHDSCAVVTCAKICCGLIASNGITARRSFHRIWIAGKKSLVKWAPGPEIVLLKLFLQNIVWSDISICLF